MKIYDRAGFPNPARIRIVLAEKGLDKNVEFVSVDLIGAEHPKFTSLSRNELMAYDTIGASRRNLMFGVAAAAAGAGILAVASPIDANAASVKA